MKTSRKTRHSLGATSEKLHISQVASELAQVRTDLHLVNEKLTELYSTMRMIFEHHPDEKEFLFQIVDTDRFNRVIEKTGFEELILELEDHLQELKDREVELESQLCDQAG